MFVCERQNLKKLAPEDFNFIKKIFYGFSDFVDKLIEIYTQQKTDGVIYKVRLKQTISNVLKLSTKCGGTSSTVLNNLFWKFHTSMGPWRFTVLIKAFKARFGSSAKTFAASARPGIPPLMSSPACLRNLPINDTSPASPSSAVLAKPKS